MSPEASPLCLFRRYRTHAKAYDSERQSICRVIPGHQLKPRANAILFILSVQEPSQKKPFDLLHELPPDMLNGVTITCSCCCHETVELILPCRNCWLHSFKGAFDGCGLANIPRHATDEYLLVRGFDVPGSTSSSRTQGVRIIPFETATKPEIPNPKTLGGLNTWFGYPLKPSSVSPLTPQPGVPKFNLRRIYGLWHKSCTNLKSSMPRAQNLCLGREAAADLLEEWTPVACVPFRQRHPRCTSNTGTAG